MSGCDAVNDSGIPVVQNPDQVIQEDHWHAGLHPEFSVRKACSADIDRPGWRALVGGTGSGRLRELIQQQGRFYVLAVSANTCVWTERPEVQEPEEQTGGRPRRARRLAKGAPSARLVSEVVTSWPASAWKRFAVLEGEKGPIEYRWARAAVVESRDQLPGPDV